MIYFWIADGSIIPSTAESALRLHLALFFRTHLGTRAARWHAGEILHRLKHDHFVYGVMRGYPVFKHTQDEYIYDYI